MTALRIPPYRAWKFYRNIASPKLPDGRTVVPKLTGKHYLHGKGDAEDSMIRYFFDGKLVFSAWGRRKAKHCGAHAVKNPKGGWYPAVIGCPVAVPRKNVRGEIIGFVIKTPASKLTY